MGQLLVVSLLSPFFGRHFPVFPYAAAAFLGLAVGHHLAQDGGKPTMVRKLLTAGLVVTIFGATLGLFTGNLMNDHEAHKTEDQVLTLGMTLIAHGLFLGAFEARITGLQGHDRFVSRTTWLRRFGLQSLSVWMYQWLRCGADGSKNAARPKRSAALSS